MSIEDLNVGVKLPLYSCPFLGVDGKACHFNTNDRNLFLHHVAGGVLDKTHVPKQLWKPFFVGLSLFSCFLLSAMAFDGYVCFSIFVQKKKEPKVTLF